MLWVYGYVLGFHDNILDQLKYCKKTSMKLWTEINTINIYEFKYTCKQYNTLFYWH